MTQFIGYHVAETGLDGAPVSTGKTKQEALERCFFRVLSQGISSGTVTLVERKDLNAADFETLTASLDAAFAVSQ